MARLRLMHSAASLLLTPLLSTGSRCTAAGALDEAIARVAPDVPTWAVVCLVFPQARFYHKSGVISNYALDVAYVDDSAVSGKRFILVPVIHAGYATQPTGGEARVGEMAQAIAAWVKAQP